MKVLFWFLVVVIVSWIMILYILPIFAKFYLRRMARKFEQANQSNQANKKQDGSVFIDHQPEPQKKHSQTGEYVDFEDINEK